MIKRPQNCFWKLGTTRHEASYVLSTSLCITIQYIISVVMLAWVASTLLGRPQPFEDKRSI